MDDKTIKKLNHEQKNLSIFWYILFIYDICALLSLWSILCFLFDCIPFFMNPVTGILCFGIPTIALSLYLIHIARKLQD